MTRLNNVMDRFVGTLVRGYFTKSSMLAHVIVYPVLMSSEGGDFHLFLDAISIEAVFVGLMVGISTKTVIAHSRRLHRLVSRSFPHLHHDLEDDEL